MQPLYNPDKITHLFAEFATPSSFVRATRIPAGHINQTFCVETSDRHYVLQALNLEVFSHYREVMANTEVVLRCQRQWLQKNGGDLERNALQLIPLRSGGSFLLNEAGLWRCFPFIANSCTFETPLDREMVYQAGLGYGRFQRQTENLDETLFETIPDFHHTPKRLAALAAAVEADVHGRLSGCQQEAEYLLSQPQLTAALVAALEDGAVPLRVTHNDTKLSNLLFDQHTHESLCVIDLDTVMMGSALFDFGDALRSVCSDCAENEPDTRKAVVKEHYVLALAAGFLDGTAGSLTTAERELLVTSGAVILIEIGARFLTDYLEGDHYFRVSHAQENLDRARIQIALAQDLLRKRAVLEERIRALPVAC